MFFGKCRPCSLALGKQDLTKFINDCFLARLAGPLPAFICVELTLVVTSTVCLLSMGSASMSPAAACPSLYLQGIESFRFAVHILEHEATRFCQLQLAVSVWKMHHHAYHHIGKA